MLLVAAASRKLADAELSDRDSFRRVDSNGGICPNYEPNSFGGAIDWD
jgi:hypothetical protein